MRIEQLDHMWDNPYRIFCYSTDLRTFMTKLPFLMNEFVLVSHNEDANITAEYMPILEHPLLKHWYAQNILIRHEKLTSIPIGVANEMWPHGNLDTIVHASNHTNQPRPTDFYFNFDIGTNPGARNLCRTELEKKGLQFVERVPFGVYVQHMLGAKFTISPPGNGVDCHRIWEAYYMGVIPILLRSGFTEQVAENFPCILLDKWDDFDHNACLSQYDELYAKLLTVTDKLKFSYYKNMILQS